MRKERHIVVIGGANSAGQAAVLLQPASRGSVTMLVRGATLERSMSHYLIEQIAALDKVEVRTGTRPPPPRRGRPAARCTSPAPAARRRSTPTPCFVFIGASPRTD